MRVFAQRTLELGVSHCARHTFCRVHHPCCHCHRFPQLQVAFYMNPSLMYTSVHVQYTLNRVEPLWAQVLFKSMRNNEKYRPKSDWGHYKVRASKAQWSAFDLPLSFEFYSWSFICNVVGFMKRMTNAAKREMVLWKFTTQRPFEQSSFLPSHKNTSHRYGRDNKCMQPNQNT